MSDPTPQRLPKYRHFRPKDLPVVRLNGKDHDLGRYGSEASREKYRRLLAQWLAGTLPEVPGKTPGAGNEDEEGPSVAELILAYLTWADGYYVKDGRSTSEPSNIRAAMRPLRRLYGLTPARDFGPVALKDVRTEMVASGLCRNEVNKRVRQIVRLFRWAVEDERVAPTAHQALRAVPGLRRGRSEARESEPVRPVPDDRVDAIRPHVAPQVWAMIELQRLTGMRPGEVTIMRTCDLDVTGPIWAYRPGSHKTEHHGRDRVIYLGPQAQAIVGRWLRTDLTAYLFSPRDAVEERLAARRRNRRTPMTPSQRARKRKPRPRRSPGKHYDVAAYGHAIAKGCDRAFPHPTLDPIPREERTDEQRAELRAWRQAHRWHPNQLRHNASTKLRKRYGLEASQVVLGHASADITQTYAERDLAAARRIMGEIG